MRWKQQCVWVICILFLLAVPFAAFATEGTVDTKALVLRKSASKESKALQTLDKGTSLEVLGVSGSWYKVNYGKYTGYVMKKYVKVDGTVEDSSAKAETKQSSGSGKTIASLGDAPATSRPGDNGAKVKKLQQALTILGHYTGSIDGKYGDGTTEAVKAFQKTQHLSQDGIAGKVTIKLLFDQPAANSDQSAKKEYTTERLNWFKGGSDVIPKGATFTVKDVKTGHTFTVKRWSGANHLDAEPYSKDDTATMKTIYGGSWSWKRRAILVKYDGHVYAASMNGMPHGTSTIDGNNFDGHFCIHFYGSKTHGTKKVDTAHQNEVDNAMRATW